jgi:hypothetical protein
MTMKTYSYRADIYPILNKKKVSELSLDEGDGIPGTILKIVLPPPQNIYQKCRKFYK